MKNALETIVSNLVSNSDAVTIKETAGEKSVIFEVKVSSSDMGKVIGKDGRIARAIRIIMKALAAKEEKKVIVEFIDAE